MNFPGVVSNLKKNKRCFAVFFNHCKLRRLPEGWCLCGVKRGPAVGLFLPMPSMVDPGRAMKQMNPLMFPQNFRVENGYL